MDKAYDIELDKSRIEIWPDGGRYVYRVYNIYGGLMKETGSWKKAYEMSKIIDIMEGRLL